MSIFVMNYINSFPYVSAKVYCILPMHTASSTSYPCLMYILNRSTRNVYNSISIYIYVVILTEKCNFNCLFRLM